MRGGSLQVCATGNGDVLFTADLLWECADCEVATTALVEQGAMKLLFRSSSSPIGTGFRAYYASLKHGSSVTVSESTHSSNEVEFVLFSPQPEQFLLDTDNSSAWYMLAATDSQSIVYEPGKYIVDTASNSGKWSVADGRTADLLRQLYSDGIEPPGG